MRRKLFLSSILVFVLLSFGFVVSVEASSTGWSQAYGGTSRDIAHSLVETSDGGYAIAGDTYSFGAGNADCWLVKTDDAGNVEWNKTYGGANIDAARSLVVTYDGGYALAGCRLLIKTDEFGNMEWNKTYRGTCYSLIATSDRGYALAGDTTGDFWLIKTDEYGSMEWSQTYGGEGDDRAKSLIESNDGGFVLAGVKDSVRHQWYGHPISGNFWLVKTNASGNMEWNRTYGGTGGDHAYSLVETSDGGYAIAGETGSFGAGEADFWLIKTDAYGIIPEWYPPYICVGSPQNITYTTDSVSLNFTVNEEASWMGYSLDGQDNLTLTETTLNVTDLVNGSHALTVYATDTADNTAASETISFTIAKEDETPTTWTTTAIAIAAVAAAGAAILLYYTKTKKNRTKNENILGS